MLNDYQLNKFSKLFNEKIKPAITENLEGFNRLAKKAEQELKQRPLNNK